MIYYIYKNTNKYTEYVVVIFIWWSPFIPSRNLDEVFTYNHMDLMSLRSRSHVRHLRFNENRSFIYTQLYKITSKYYFKTYFNSLDKA